MRQHTRKSSSPLTGQCHVRHVQATTIDNAAFGVVGGQAVELLVLHTNSDIPTALIGADYTMAYIDPLANMAESIADSSQLVQVIKAFVESKVNRCRDSRSNQTHRLHSRL
jgi:hypothetical protein